MSKQIILENVDPETKDIFSELWGQIEKEFGEQIALSYCQMVASDPQQYYNTLFASYDSVCSTILSMISQEKLQISSQKPKSPSKDPSPTKKIKEDVVPQKNSIKNPQIIQEHKKQVAQKQFSHLEQIKLNLKRDRQFASNFTEKDFDQFEQFHMIYNHLPLIQKSQIQKETKRNSSASNDMETLMNQLLVVDSALYHTTPQHRLRITQILAIYGFLLKPKLKTILFQILTGEGKTTTIACLAAILTMKGRNVDIITTNNILAKRDVDQKRKFFNLLGLKVDHNIPPEGDQGNKVALQARPCYEKGTVVYGTPFTYQVDLLYDEYKKRSTRNGRPYDVAIIDEVDSMFIDEKANQTLLSSTFAGFSDLVLPMRILWQTIVLNNIVKEGDSLILYKQGEKQGEIIKGQMNEVMRIIVEDIRSKFKNEIIPHWRQEFIEFSMKDWIWSAIQAAHIYKEDQHYVIRNNKVIPVDYKNTGCLQNNVEWEHGLHQFLQIKHDLEVSVESMTSNFMSNIGHFTRYRTIYGLTGTLGSQKSKQFLQKTYKAQMLEIPPFLERRLKIEPGFFMYCDSEWMEKILQRVTQLMKQNRSVLVICQTIKHVKVIEEAIKFKKVPFKSIRCHLTGQQKHSDNVDCQEIIIATNVAGRGTDLKASKKLIQNGGLHVMISFMPENLRVQMQARGRAGRNGAPGSSELIVNHQEYFDEVLTTPIEEYKFRASGMESRIGFVCQNIRDEIQANSMEKDLQKVEELKTKDRAFEYFCKTVGKIPDYQTNKAKRDALEEAWAMFLKKAACLKLNNQELQAEAKNLVDSFAKDSERFYNPSHNVWRGINEINQDNLQQAKHHFKALDAPNTTMINKITGRVMQSSIDIKLDDKKTKANYGNALNMMASCIGLIEERKEIIKGINSVNLTSNNRKIVGIMNQQNKKEQQKLLTSLNKEKNEINPIQGAKILSNVQMTKNQNIEPIERKNIQEMMNIPEINALNAIGEHIKKQMSVVQNVKPNEYVEIKFEPLSKIIDMTENKQKQSKEEIDKLATQMPILPVFEVKKIKVPWWKRVLVFAVGILQICLGALIVSASGGAAAAFGSHMIISGFESCMTAIFNPELCNDLSKFFTKKAIEYTCAIAMIGTQGIMELAKMSKNGFQLIKNSTMSEVFSKAITGIKEGLVKGGLDIGAIIKKTAFMGLSSQLTGQKIGQDINETFKVLQKPQVKKMVDEGINDEKKLQFKGKAVQQNFQVEADKLIKQMVADEYPKFINEIKDLKMDSSHIRIMIDSSFKQEFSKYFGQKDRSEIYKEMLAFISKNLMEKDLANKVIKQFKIDQLIKTTIQNMGKSQNYDIVVKNSQNMLRNQICQAFNQAIEKYRQEIQTLQNQLKTEGQKINTERLTNEERQRRITAYNARVEGYKTLSEKYQAFAQEFHRMDQGNNLASYLINNKVIVNGKVDKNSNSYRQLHPYNQAVLSKVSNFETGENQFKEILETSAYNSFAGIAVKAVGQIIDNSSCSVSRLKWIEQKFMESMQQP